MHWGQSEQANVRDLPKLWDHQREREGKKRTFPWKALMCSLTHSQNKGLNKYQGELAGCIQVPPLCQRQRSRCVTARAGRQGAVSAPETCILYQNASRLPVANHFFLGPWMVDIHQEGHILRSAPRGDTRHTWDGALVAHLGNRVTGPREVIKTHSPPETVCSPSTWLPELLGPGKGTKCTPNQVYALAEYLRTWVA